MILAFLLSTTTAFTLPLNNPTQASLISEGIFSDPSCDKWFDFCNLFEVRTGFYGDYIFNTHMKVKSSDATISVLSVNTSAGIIGVNVCNVLDIYGVLGAAKIKLETTSLVIRQAGNSLLTDQFFVTDSRFAWSVGARASIFEACGFDIGLEGQYYSTRPHLNIGHNPIRYFNDVSMKYRSWQVGLGLAYAIPITECFGFSPYVGVFWLDSRLSTGNYTYRVPGVQTRRLYDLQKDGQVGWAFGTTLIGGQHVTITAEGRWIGESAVFVTGEIQF
ncbi:MAG: hypothetical protein ACKVOH_00710 [Chlamydiales bacterium]